MDGIGQAGCFSGQIVKLFFKPLARLQLPEKFILNFPVQGPEMEMGDTKLTAWATQNKISAQNAPISSKLMEHPRCLIPIMDHWSPLDVWRGGDVVQPEQEFP